MKLRSSILFGCLLVVPLLAMFSHKVPRDVRDGFRDRVWRPVVGRVSDWFAGEEERQPATLGQPVVANVPVGPPQAVAVTPAAAPPPPEPKVMPPVTVGSTELPQLSRTSLDGRLESLGAVGLQVKQPDGGAGVHVASCRVAVDAGGQLQRFFQSNGPTAEVSLERLAKQIEAWRGRIAVRESSGDAPIGVDSSSPPAPVPPRFR